MSVQRYRKRPVEVEAIQYTVQNWRSVAEWLGKAGATFSIPPFQPTELSPPLTIHTLEGDMSAPLGWWIIRGVAGEFYPCKPDIFAATYDAVEPEAVR